MLRRKVDNPDEPAAETEAPEAGAPDPKDAAAEAVATSPDSPATEPETAPEVEPAGVLEEDIRDEEIEVTETPTAPPEPDASPAAPEPPAPQTPPGPGPLARHSPEPQTMAERLAAQQQATHEQPVPDPKAQLKERREASKRQRKADKAKRKADKKAAKQARKARRKTDSQPGPLELDPLSPTTPAERPQPTNQPVALPPISMPGGTSGAASGRSTRRTAALIGGIDLGGTKIAAAVLDADHKVVAYRRRPTPDKGGPADVVRAMAVTMQEAATDAGTEAHRLLAVGVGSPGSVNTETGAVSGAGNLPDWDGTFQLGMALREELGTEVRVGNDVQVGTRAEYELGAGSEHSSLLGVFWGTGVGGGIIINGEPWLGRGRAGEIGHTLVRRGGAKGLNGLNGTVEAYAGRKAMEAKARREVKKGRKTKLFKLMKKHEKTHLTSAIWQRALEDGDELAEDLLNRAVAALSAGIGSAINLLDPEAVVIGGGLGVRFADTLVPEIIDGMTPYLLNKENPPEVKVAALGDEGGVIGASLLVKDVFEANQAPST
jgi:glucokinase